MMTMIQGSAIYMFQFAVMSRIEQQINDDNNRNMFRIATDTFNRSCRSING